jgi:hypothetical protein
MIIFKGLIPPFKPETLDYYDYFVMMLLRDLICVFFFIRPVRLLKNMRSGLGLLNNLIKTSGLMVTIQSLLAG